MWATVGALLAERIQASFARTAMAGGLEEEKTSVPMSSSTCVSCPEQVKRTVRLVCEARWNAVVPAFRRKTPSASVERRSPS